MLQKTLTSEIAPPSPGPNAPALEYAAPPPAYRRRRFRRRLVFLLSLLILSAAGLRWGRDIASRAALLYHQRACRLYTAPPDQIVFSSDATDLAALSRQRDYTTGRGFVYRN